MKSNNIKLENKLQISINEINKANDIIEKFQNEIKNQKSKMKSIKLELNKKNKIINQQKVIISNNEKEMIEIKKENENNKKNDIILENELNQNPNELFKEEKNNNNIEILQYLNSKEIEKRENFKSIINSERDTNVYNLSNPDYNPSYFFTFYKQKQINSPKQLNKKSNKETENEKNEENDNYGIYNNFQTYQFREIKGNCISIIFKNKPK